MSEQQQTQRKASYTNVAQMYDRDHSSIKFGYINHDIYIEIAPVFDAMAGKDVVQKGEKMYDYDNRLFSSIRANLLPLLVKQVNALNEGKINEFVIETASRTISFGCGGLFEGIDGITVSVTEKDQNGNELRDVLFAFEAPKEHDLGYIYDDEGEAETVTVEAALDWDWFVSWINNAVLENSYALAEQGARLGAPAGATAPRANRPSGGNAPKKRIGKRPSSRPTATTTEDAGSAVDAALGDDAGKGEKIDFEDDVPM